MTFCDGIHFQLALKSVGLYLKRRTKRDLGVNLEKKQSKEKPKAAITKKKSSIAKRELFTLGAILLGVIGCFASGGIVAMAMNGQEEKRQINLLNR